MNKAYEHKTEENLKRRKFNKTKIIGLGLLKLNLKSEITLK
jgi:hypothetical protein